MRREQRCEEVRNGLAEYLAHSLDASAARALEEHVSSCAACQAEYAGVDEMWQALGEVRPPLVPANRMRERFSAMLAAERALSDRRPAFRRIGQRRWTASLGSTGGPLVQTALAASLLIAGLIVGRATLSRPATPPAPQGSEIAEVRSELRRAGTPSPANDIWIAALCREHGLALVSHDEHFDAVSGMRRLAW